MSIGLDDVKEYVDTFGRNSGRQVARGFFFHEGQCVISHAGAKLTLTPEEETAVVTFLSDYYDLG